MSFTKNDLEAIKSKIQLSTEIEKRVKVIKRGNDYWCCCPFHEEKTPSCKINNDLGSYYCFGCGAKGDIFTIYTDLYNFSFPDAVKELAQKVGIKILNKNSLEYKENEIIYKILEITTKWFEKNLEDNKNCKKYLEKRFISNETIKIFRIGFSYNKNISLYEFLKNQNFKDNDIFKSNVVKKDANNKIRDFFYKRLIFPIFNEQNKVVGFGGRVLDDSNPKYINSPESNFFKKRNILYNLNNAKQFIRSKNNILICEGYMDVISLYENNIKTAVAPLGTALTENQLFLSWKYVKKPTIMFDGDSSGLKASYKSALMALPLLTPDKYLQFITLPNNYDPDSYINNYSLKLFVNLLKTPKSLVNFIFDQSSSTIDLNNADNKITFDKYLDDIIETIKDKKIKYFYKTEFKSLFFKKLKNKNSFSSPEKKTKSISKLNDKQIYSFLGTFINQIDIRDELAPILIESKLLEDKQIDLINFIIKDDKINLTLEDILKSNIPNDILREIEKTTETRLFQLFPYCSKQYDSGEALSEVKDSIKNLNTRLLNLKKINKSLIEFDDNSSALKWEELRSIGSEILKNEEI